MSKLFTCALYFLSYAPLWISVLFIDVKSICEHGTELWTEKISIGCIVVFTLVSLIVLKNGLNIGIKDGSNHHTIKGVVEKKSITAEFLLSYILPLFAFNFTLWNEVVLFLIFFLTLAFLCIKHNYFSINIVLELFNFQFYDCTLENEDGQETTQMVISRRKLNGCIGDEIYLKALNNEIKLDVDK